MKEDVENSFRLPVFSLSSFGNPYKCLCSTKPTISLADFQLLMYFLLLSDWIFWIVWHWFLFLAFLLWQFTILSEFAILLLSFEQCFLFLKCTLLLELKIRLIANGLFLYNGIGLSSTAMIYSRYYLHYLLPLPDIICIVFYLLLTLQAEFYCTAYWMPYSLCAHFKKFYNSPGIYRLAVKEKQKLNTLCMHCNPHCMIAKNSFDSSPAPLHKGYYF